MWSRNTYPGTRRRLVIAFDVGTTWSGISYSILDPGRVPKVEGVTRFPSHEEGRILSLSKVPSVLYYDTEGNLKAIGAETLSESVKEAAYNEHWIKVEWFKLHLRPKQNEKDGADPIPPLPSNKRVEDVFADYLRYLNKCAFRFIEHAHGADMWTSLSSTISPTADATGRYPVGQGAVYVLSHPNGWEGYHQQVYAKGVTMAGLLPDNAECLYERLQFVTEGEASLHWASSTLGSSASMKQGTGFTVVDAGGGTIDVSSYRRKKKESEERGAFEEIGPPTCYFQGSIFVTVRARTYLKAQLIDSEYIEDIDDILEAFDDTTKLHFRDPEDPQYVRFGSVSDNDAAVGIRFGQLRLKGHDVAALFKPAIDCIHDAVIEQRKLANKSISHVILVGGFVNNDYLYESVKSALASISVKVHRLDNLPNKAVANGAVSFYLDHFVRARYSKVAYGFFGNVGYNKKDKYHRKRHATHRYTNLKGDVMLTDLFAEMLPKNVSVSEFKETRRRLYGLSQDSFASGKDVVTTIWCYKGNNKKARFWGQEMENYSQAFTIVVNADHVPLTKATRNGKTYDVLAFDLVLYFGLPALKADIAWKEGDVEMRSPAKITYHYPWDQIKDTQSPAHPASFGSIADHTNNSQTIDSLT